MIKQTVAHPYYEILFSNTKELLTQAAVSSTESQKHYSKWKKASLKRLHIKWIYFYDILKKTKLWGKNQWLPGVGEHLGEGRKTMEGITQGRF